MSSSSTNRSPSLADLPQDELVVYAANLGLYIDPDTPHGELLRLIRERRELLLELNRSAMLDIVVWARIPVRQSVSKEELAKQISDISKSRFEDLSDRGVWAFAKLREISVVEGDSRSTLEKRLRRQEGLFARINRKRRRFLGSMLGKIVAGAQQSGQYKFLPDDPGHPTLKESIENRGVVEGIAQKIRGAADHYVEEKLDEIERRIDAKLDQIDRRLSEWRDREIKNRLKLVKITLLTAIVVAILSLGYDYVQGKAPGELKPSPTMIAP